MTANADNSVPATTVAADEAVVMHSTELKEASSSVKAPKVASSVTEANDVADIVVDESPVAEEKTETVKVAIVAKGDVADAVSEEKTETVKVAIVAKDVIADVVSKEETKPVQAAVVTKTAIADAASKEEAKPVQAVVVAKGAIADVVTKVTKESPVAKEATAPVVVTAKETSIDEVAPIIATVAAVVSEDVRHSEPETEQQVADVDADADDTSVPEPGDTAVQDKSAVADTAKSKDTSQDDHPDRNTEQPIPDNTKPSDGKEDDNTKPNDNKKDDGNKPKEKEDNIKPSEEEEDEEVQIVRPRVQVYGSTVSGNREYKRQAKTLFTMLEAEEVDFEFICIAADEQAKKYLRRKALGNMTIPQIYVDGELRGFYDDAFKANEIGDLYDWLRLDEEPVDY
ncbi:hypothetical protein FBU31_001069 [Coemansia sp. 'formosensis']|nr:hypothetical protein FBU31_001069 [Coemansia sp. 'formosensis']